MIRVNRTGGTSKRFPESFMFRPTEREKNEVVAKSDYSCLNTSTGLRLAVWRVIIAVVRHCTQQDKQSTQRNDPPCKFGLISKVPEP